MYNCGILCIIEIILTIITVVMLHTLAHKFSKLNKKYCNGAKPLKQKLSWLFLISGIALLFSMLELFLKIRITALTIAIVLVAIYPFFEEVN